MKRRFFAFGTALALMAGVVGGFTVKPAAAEFDPNEGYLSDCLSLTVEGFESCLEAIISLIQQTLTLPPVANPNVDLQEIIHNALDPVLDAISGIFQNAPVNTQTIAAPQQAPLVPDVVGTIGNTLNNLTNSVSGAVGTSAGPAFALPEILGNLPKVPLAKVIKLQGINDFSQPAESPFSSADLAGMAALAGIALIGGTSVVRRRVTAKANS